MSHSPGPWTYIKKAPQLGESEGDRIISDATGEELMCDEPYYPWCSSNEDDWPLIAAAPDLLEAIKACLPFIDDALDAHQVMSDSAVTEACMQAVQAANAAVAKAEGRS